MTLPPPQWTVLQEGGGGEVTPWMVSPPDNHKLRICRGGGGQLLGFGRQPRVVPTQVSNDHIKLWGKSSKCMNNGTFKELWLV